MKKTVLITGCSTGIGRATAKHFAQQNWNVAATMRQPSKETELNQIENIKLFELDVISSQSIKQAIADALQAYGNIDVIVNNAGYGTVGVFEAAEKEQIQRQFDTNVFGVMNVIREILPYFREKKEGCIVNVTSIAAFITFPCYSIYHATKFAVEGFTESLQFELRPFNIRIKNIAPGAIKTDFYTRSQDVFNKPGLTAYDNYTDITYKTTQHVGNNAPGPEIVAKTIYKAATAHNYRLRYPAGFQAKAVFLIKKFMPYSWIKGIVKIIVEKGYIPK
ncbi:MAG: SDR family oxidoreductase [Bacteroidetes bacterium]|nr:SDR family oxidoreductase [Bacteroidota bacterium]